MTQPEFGEADHKLAHPLHGVFQCFIQVRGVVERRGSGHQRKAVDVERWAHTIEQVGYLGR